MTGVQSGGQAVSILLRGTNKLVIDEADRSLHDALCVIRCLVKKRALISGGGAPEMEVYLPHGFLGFFMIHFVTVLAIIGLHSVVRTMLIQLL